MILRSKSLYLCPGSGTYLGAVLGMDIDNDKTRSQFCINVNDKI